MHINIFYNRISLADCIYISFSHKELGVTQSLHGNVYKIVSYKGQVTTCNYFCAVHQVASVCLHRTIQSPQALKGHNLMIVNIPHGFWIPMLCGIVISNGEIYSGVELTSWTFQWDLTLKLLIWSFYTWIDILLNVIKWFIWPSLDFFSQNPRGIKNPGNGHISTGKPYWKNWHSNLSNPPLLWWYCCFVCRVHWYTRIASLNG